MTAREAAQAAADLGQNGYVKLSAVGVMLAAAFAAGGTIKHDSKQIDQNQQDIAAVKAEFRPILNDIKDRLVRIETLLDEQRR